MPVSFTDPNGLELDHQVELYLFYIIILMMVHDGFHDFYDNKSKESFANLFKKFAQTDEEALEARKTSAYTRIAGTAAAVMGGGGSMTPGNLSNLETALNQDPPDTDDYNTLLQGASTSGIINKAGFPIEEEEGVPITTSPAIYTFLNYSYSLIKQGQYKLQNIIEEIYLEIHIGDNLKEPTLTILNMITNKTINVLLRKFINEGRTIDLNTLLYIIKDFIISEFYKLKPGAEIEEIEKILNEDVVYFLEICNQTLTAPAAPDLAPFTPNELFYNMYNAGLIKELNEENRFTEFVDVISPLQQVYHELEEEEDAAIREVESHFDERKASVEEENDTPDEINPSSRAEIQEYIFNSGALEEVSSEETTAIAERNYKRGVEFFNDGVRVPDDNFREALNYFREAQKNYEKANDQRNTFHGMNESREAWGESAAVVQPHLPGSRYLAVGNKQRGRRGRSNQRMRQMLFNLSRQPTVVQRRATQSEQGDKLPRTTSTVRRQDARNAKAREARATQHRAARTGLIGGADVAVVQPQQQPQQQPQHAPRTPPCLQYLRNFTIGIIDKTCSEWEMIFAGSGKRGCAGAVKSFNDEIYSKDKVWWSDSGAVGSWFLTKGLTLQADVLDCFVEMEGVRTPREFNKTSAESQLQIIKNLIDIYDNRKKYLSQKLFNEVKTKSFNLNVYHPDGTNKDLFDELSVEYEFGETKKKSYLSITEFLFILVIFSSGRVDPRILKQFPIKRQQLNFSIRGSKNIGSYEFGRHCDEQADLAKSGEGRPPRPGYENKEQYKLYQAINSKIESLCGGEVFANILDETISLLTPFYTNKEVDGSEKLNKYINVYKDILDMLNKMKIVIETCKPSLEGKITMSGTEEDKWQNIFKCFAQDYLELIPHELFVRLSEGVGDLFYELLMFGHTNSSNADDIEHWRKHPPKGTKLDQEIWKKLSSGWIAFDQLYGMASGFKGIKVVNNAMPPQLKKLYKTLLYLCNTSILDPMSTFGSCTRVPFRGPYTLKYRIRHDDNNYIFIELPVVANNDVSIVDGRVIVKVSGQIMVSDTFTLSHFNSSEPFSINSIVSDLHDVDPWTRHADGATRDTKRGEERRTINRNILFRKFLGDFLQALQVFTKIANRDYAVYYTANDKPASIMLQILLYSLNNYETPGRPGVGVEGNFGGHVEKKKPASATSAAGYKWFVHYTFENLSKYMDKYIRGVVRGGGLILNDIPIKITRRKNTRKKDTRRRNTRRKNTRKKDTRRKNTRRRNTRRRNTRRRNTRRRNTRRKK